MPPPKKSVNSQHPAGLGTATIPNHSKKANTGTSIAVNNAAAALTQSSTVSNTSGAPPSFIELQTNQPQQQQQQYVSPNAKVIADAKFSIQNFEKTYRESQHLRRLQNNPTIVFSEGASGAFIAEIPSISSAAAPTTFAAAGSITGSGSGGLVHAISTMDFVGGFGSVSGEEILEK
ncbi:hypothetical protein HK100_007166, partial [Physocladia obscura]